MPIFWRVFLLNAALLVATGIVLAVSPLTINPSIRDFEEAVLAAAILVLLAVNYAMLRPTFKPLERLAKRMKNVDLLLPGRPLTPTGSSEVVALVQSFNEMLERLETERRESGRRALAAQEAERKRIAAEVPASRRKMFAEAQEATRKSVEEVRRLAQELRPELLEHLGLVSALKSLATTFTQRAGLQLESEFARDLPALSPDAELAVYRIAQESLTNVARHAGASRVWVSLQAGHQSLVLRVVDDGHGMNSGGSGGGLRGMRERAVMVGAALAIKPAADGGVEVRLEVPTHG